jgi:hypothetical protein
MSTVASKPDKYRRYAEDCWKFSNDAEDIETKGAVSTNSQSVDHACRASRDA